MIKCELGEHNQCCCVCRWRLEAHLHDAFPKKDFFSYVCVGFAFMEGEPVAYLNDFEHGLCELFKRRHTIETEEEKEKVSHED